MEFINFLRRKFAKGNIQEEAPTNQNIESITLRRFINDKTSGATTPYNCSYIECTLEEAKILQDAYVNYQKQLIGDNYIYTKEIRNGLENFTSRNALRCDGELISLDDHWFKLYPEHLIDYTDIDFDNEIPQEKFKVSLEELFRSGFKNQCAAELYTIYFKNREQLKNFLDTATQRGYTTFTNSAFKESNNPENFSTEDNKKIYFCNSGLFTEEIPDYDRTLNLKDISYSVYSFNQIADDLKKYLPENPTK